jgi:hypothetical protein
VKTTFDDKFQAGVVGASQLLASGWTHPEIRNQLRGQRWRRLLPGIYATYTGEPTIESWWWAAHLYCGEESALGGASALQAWGVTAKGLPVEIDVPWNKRIDSVEGLMTIHRRRTPRPVRSRRNLPPAVVAHEAVLDVVDTFDSGQDLAGLIAKACQSGAASPEQIERGLKARTRHRHRAVIGKLLEAVRGGATSVLEIDGVNNILKAHGLPTGTGQAVERQDGQTVRRDRRIDPFGLVLEFDGRLGHSDADGQFRDMHRDNAVMLTMRPTLRYGWVDVQFLACEAAAQIARILTNLGWTGTLESCGKNCRG